MAICTSFESYQCICPRLLVLSVFNSFSSVFPASSVYKDVGWSTHSVSRSAHHLFGLNNSHLCCAELFNLMQLRLWILAIISRPVRASIRKSLPIICVFFMFSSSSLKIAGLAFRLFICFHLIFAEVGVRDSISVFDSGVSGFPASLVKGPVFSPRYYF